MFRYGIAYGDGNDGPFIGGANFALMQEGGATYHNFFFQVPTRAHIYITHTHIHTHIHTHTYTYTYSGLLLPPPPPSCAALLLSGAVLR
jgi:hypothetical protein